MIRSALYTLAGACLLWVGAVSAQDLDGRDTASNWRGTHHSFHGIWNTICDEREEHGTLKKRCYVRWVDVYAPNPKFGALFVFVTPRKNGKIGQYNVMFGPEVGSVFLPGGFVVTDVTGAVTWKLEGARCRLLADCTFTDAQSDSVLDAMIAGETLDFSFVDRHLRRFDLQWSLRGFSEALKTLQTQWELRQ